MSLPKRDEQLHTYAEYLTWQGEERYELIDGVAYLMAPPAPTLEHQDFAGEIYLQLRQGLDGKPCRVFVAPVDVRLPKFNEADGLIDTVVQPDVLVVCDAGKLNRKKGVRGAPDFVVEVLSPSTASHDHLRKRRVYEKAGVREFWLVHPTDRLLTIYRLEGKEFGKPEFCELTGETPISALPGVSIAWEGVTARNPQADD